MSEIKVKGFIRRALAVLLCGIMMAGSMSVTVSAQTNDGDVSVVEDADSQANGGDVRIAEDADSQANGGDVRIAEDADPVEAAVGDDEYAAISADTEIEHGRITVDKTKALPGETVEVLAYPDNGYELGFVTCDCEIVEKNEEGRYLYVVPEWCDECTFSAVFKQTGQGNFYIDYEFYEEEVCVEGPEWANAGETVHFTLSPTADFSYGGTGVYISDSNYEDVPFSQEDEGTYSFTMPSGNVNVYIWTDEAFNINIMNTDGGQVTANFQKAVEGTTVTLTVTPDEGYVLDVLLLYGYEELEADENGVYRFEMPSEDVTVSAEWVTGKPAFKTYALTLGEQIGVIFYMDLPEDLGLHYENSFMYFTIEGDIGGKSVAYADSTLNASKKYRGFTCNLSSIRMADTITAEFCYYNDEGEERSVSTTYSVAKYVSQFTELAQKYPEQYGDALPIIHALADYGHYAQLYFSDYKGWTIGVEHAEMPARNVLNGYSDSEIQEIITALSDYEIRKTLSEDMEKVSFATDLDSKTAIKLYFKPKGDCEEGVRATIDGIGTDVEVKGGRYVVTISGIKAHQLGEWKKVVFTTSTGTTTVNVNAMSYALAALKSSSKENLRAMMAAFYHYYDEAIAYMQNSR